MCELGRVPFAGRDGEGVHRRVDRVVAQQVLDDQQERRLAAAAGPVEEQDAVLLDRPRGTISGDTLQVLLQGFVAARRLSQLFVEKWAAVRLAPPRRSP